MGGYLEEEIADGSRYRAVHVFAPGQCLFVIVNGHNEINVIRRHTVYVLVTWYGKSLCRPELRMGVEIAYLLQLVKPRQYWFYLLMVLAVVFDSFMPPVCSLDAEGMLNYKPVFKFIPEKEAETFLLIYFRGTKEKIYECILREVYAHKPFILMDRKSYR